MFVFYTTSLHSKDVRILSMSAIQSAAPTNTSQFLNVSEIEVNLKYFSDPQGYFTCFALN